ncbi:MAG TPA: SDR family NAD(P)-dependent oxidoreductase [Anaerolineae bacterium]|nr:SDR family NAD(P)-dependent oxidoreductase [Anaerolineae bacterium]
MEIDLTGRDALVTGGAAGIGRECALVLAEAGARVAVADIDLEGAQETIETMRTGCTHRCTHPPHPRRMQGMYSSPTSLASATSGQGLAVRCDLGAPRDVAALRQRVTLEMGGVDILVNCAGVISYRQGIGAISVDEWDRVLDVNLRGTYLVCREFIEGMKERGGGKIVNFSSLAARVGGIEVGIHYAASKAALIGFTRTLAKEGGPFGINVNAVAPGIILTEPVRRQIEGREDAYVAQIPLGRLGKPRDVANVVLFLVSPLSDYITGVVLDVNGGIYMG